MADNSGETPPNRREFLKKACAAGLGAGVVLVPAGAGLAVLLDPLGRKHAQSEKTFVTSLETLPINGPPKQFAIVASRVDAWSRFPNSPIGAIYLRRTGENQVEALNVVCPHAGCFVDYRREKNDFFCPCHNSAFALSGQISDANSPSPRGLDHLEVEIRNGKEVWVRFQNFQAGQPEKIPVA